MTPKQREIMKHALGAGRGAPGWRNHFVTGPGSDDYADCEALVAAGLMTKRSGGPLSGGDPVYRVTEAGQDALVGRPKTPNARSEARPACGTSRSTEELYPDGGNGMNRKLDVVTMTGEEYDALRDEIDELRKRLSQKMDDCVKAEQRQKKDAETYWTARESLVSRIERLHEALQKIASADWKEWQELASAEEFVRWAKSRALHALVENASVEWNNEKGNRPA